MAFLVPGLGAQGGQLDLAVRNGMDLEGRGRIISSSRSIIYASSEIDFDESAFYAAKNYREQINLA